VTSSILSNLSTAIGAPGALVGLASILPASNDAMVLERPQHSWHVRRQEESASVLETPRAQDPIAITTDIMLLHVKEHLEFLRHVSTGDKPLISKATAQEARLAWYATWEASGFALPIPAACTGPDGKLLFAWDKGRHHLELEFIPGGVPEFFYRDRDSGELWDEDYTIGAPISPEVHRKIRFFI